MKDEIGDGLSQNPAALMGTLMAASFMVMFLGFLTLFFAPGFKRFITFDPARHTVDSLIS